MDFKKLINNRKLIIVLLILIVIFIGVYIIVNSKHPVLKIFEKDIFYTDINELNNIDSNEMSKDDDGNFDSNVRMWYSIDDEDIFKFMEDESAIVSYSYNNNNALTEMDITIIFDDEIQNPMYTLDLTCEYFAKHKNTEDYQELSDYKSQYVGGRAFSKYGTIEIYMLVDGVMTISYEPYE